MPAQAEPWHLDKRVPIALIAAMAMQVGAFVWWASALNGQVGQHSRDIALLQAQNSERMAGERAMSERLARLEERSMQTLDAVRRIEAALGRRSELAQ